MQAFRLKHIPSGLYFTPARYRQQQGIRWKTNLHNRGKVYTSYPSLAYIGNQYWDREGREIQMDFKDWKVEILEKKSRFWVRIGD